MEEERLTKNVTDIENFESREGLTTKHTLDGIHERYTQLKLDKIEKWCAGSIPRLYSNPKHKDPINKTRIIASYYRFPLKKLYKLASKAGTWLLRKLPTKYRHFTLHSIGDLKGRLQKGIKEIKKAYGKQTTLFSFQTDVTQMYTNL